MKRFYKKKNFNKKSKIGLVICSVIILDVLFFSLFGARIGKSISYSAMIKIEELTKYYMNDSIKKYLNLDTNDYIKLNIVNNNIVNVDIDNNKCNFLLKNIINDLESNVKKIEMGEINNYHNLEMLRSNNGIVVFMPIGVATNNTLFARLGPRVPVKVSFLENVDAYVDVEVENYGINNSLIKLYINMKVEEIVELPIEKDRNNIEYKFLIASKLVNGEVPNILGGSIDSSSSIVNSGVN